ncbi:enoyl-CoA hydratase [Caldimonas tepidiphila]|uniref:enoyl-CoA hydratase n=1 Tax=Caldimonas tepidiphila TaxID=2315841 RepID=UPI000E5A30DE|nr:enoyl-CoA hydratase [Caldimonas tepidiphila]
MDIQTAVLDGVQTIEIARPGKKNALTMAMYEAMTDALQRADADVAVRAVLITGQPGVFTAGNDLEDFLQSPPDGPDAPVFRCMQALIQCGKPVVAAVTGTAIGIGTTMLLHCDLAYASDEARFGLPFTRLGLVPEFASSLLLPLRAGHVRAAEKLLLGEPFGAADALEMGLVNDLLPAGEVLAHARRVAGRFNALPAAAVRETKQLLRRGQAQAVQDALAAEVEGFVRRLRSAEAGEALQAFFDKRAPDFSRFR